MTGRSAVKSESKSRSVRPCGCSPGGCSVIRSTTLTTRIFSSGMRLRRMETAASVSSVGTSPAQAVVDDGEQRVRVGRQVDAHDVGLLVDDVVDEAGILVAEAVVVLPPDVRRQEIVERGDGTPPRDVPRGLQPLRVLVEHRVD